MGGVCPNRAPPRLPREGWYKHGQCDDGGWVYVRVYVEICDGEPNGLRGTGKIASDGRMEVRFSHNVEIFRRCEWQANGDVVWDGCESVEVCK